MKNWFKKFWDKTKKFFNVRYIIGIIGIAIIIIKGIKPSWLLFDTNSLILFIFIAVVLLFPDLWNLIVRVKKVKWGDKEVEISEIFNKLQEDTKQFDQKLENTQLENIERVEKKDFMNRINKNRSDVTACLKIIIEEIEAELKLIVKITNDPEKPKEIDVQGLTAFLTRKDILPEEICSVIISYLQGHSMLSVSNAILKKLTSDNLSSEDTHGLFNAAVTMVNILYSLRLFLEKKQKEKSS